MRKILLLLSLLTPSMLLAEESLPAWHTLVYEQKSFWVTATSRISIDSCDSAGHWCLSASSSVADNIEAIELETRGDGQLIKRDRESSGSNRRRKRWSYAADQVLRERLEPGPDEWTITSRRELPFPQPTPTITDALMLLALATPGEERSIVVHGDLNFYRVTISNDGEDVVATDDALGLSPDSREVDLVTLRAEPLLAVEDKNDFSLLGLSGDITIAWDRSSGLPLQLRGRAPRLGNVALNLKQFSLRDTPP